MRATRVLVIFLIFSYFILPAAISYIIFHNEFYIYSGLQSQANLYSLVYGFIFAIFVFVLFKPNPIFKHKIISGRLIKWRGTSVAYYAMISYSLVLILYGWKLRSMGASREDLLNGIDNFLFPGMSMILLFASFFAVARATRLQFYFLFALFLFIDVTFNGKIFSFLALILYFVRLDLSHPSGRTIVKNFTIWVVLGLSMLLLSGLMRISLAGGDFNTNAIGIAYLFGSEFLGVQASIGWGMEYYAQGYPQTFWNFVFTLQDFYLSSVGHGLAVSPGALLQANFGEGGPFVAILGCLIALVVLRLSARWLGFVAYLIVAINFQHFLRHGLDVFFVKLLSQMIFVILVAIVVNPFGRTHHPSKVQTLPNFA